MELLLLLLSSSAAAALSSSSSSSHLYFLSAHLTGQGARPLRTFLYLPCMLALLNLFITPDNFLVRIAHSVVTENKPTSTIC
jgi:hypothetical protein